MSVSVTRGTSIFTEMLGMSRYPRAQAVQQAGNRGRVSADTPAHHAHGEEDEGDAHTEGTGNLSEFEDEGQEQDEWYDDDMAPGEMEWRAKQQVAMPELDAQQDQQQQQGQEELPPPAPARSSIKSALALKALPPQSRGQLHTPSSAATVVGPISHTPHTPVSALTQDGSPLGQRLDSVASRAVSFHFSPKKGSGSSIKVRKGLSTRDLYDLDGSLDPHKQLCPLDGYGNTAMLVAARMDDVQAVRAMIDAGWDIGVTNDYGEGLMHQAAWGANSALLPLLETLVKKHKLDPNARSAIGRTPLHCAAVHGNEDMISELLRLGADASEQDSQGHTALHLAVLQRRENAIQLLLEKGAEPNSRDVKGNTPMHLAAMVNSPVVVAHLLSRGGDKTIRNEEGDTPAEVAEVYGHTWSVRFFAGAEDMSPADALALVSPSTSIDTPTTDTHVYSELQAGTDSKLPTHSRTQIHARTHDTMKQKQLSVRLRVKGQELQFSDVEMLELQGAHSIEATVPPAFA